MLKSQSNGEAEKVGDGMYDDGKRHEINFGHTLSFLQCVQAPGLLDGARQHVCRRRMEKVAEKVTGDAGFRSRIHMRPTGGRKRAEDGEIHGTLRMVK